MRYYAVSDIHGFLDPFLEALDQVGFFEDKEEKKLILCGDALDRGRQTVETVDFLLDLKEKGELIYITGNHEDCLVQALQAVARGGVNEVSSIQSHHFLNGTWFTLHDLAEMNEADALAYPQELVRRVRQSRYYRELLPAAVDYYETENHIFCHGWIPALTKGQEGNPRYRYYPHWRDASVEMWKDARWFNGMDFACRYHIREPGKTIVCGHFHASYGHSRFEHKGPEFGKKGGPHTVFWQGHHRHRRLHRHEPQGKLYCP